MAGAWQVDDVCMMCAWCVQGACMAGAWQVHGVCIVCTVCAWQVHGVCVMGVWRCMIGTYINVDISTGSLHTPLQGKTLVPC